MTPHCSYSNYLYNCQNFSINAIKLTGIIPNLNENKFEKLINFDINYKHFL